MRVGYLQPGLRPRPSTQEGAIPNVAAKNRVSRPDRARGEKADAEQSPKGGPRELSLDRGREETDVTRIRPQHRNPQLDPRQPGGTGRSGARRRNGTHALSLDRGKSTCQKTRETAFALGDLLFEVLELSKGNT